MADNTLLKYFFSSGSEVDPEGQFNLTRKTRTQRLREIYTIMQKHHFTKGFTPESFRSMLEGLGPSFVKIGQTLSTRSEILPKAHCDELKKLYEIMADTDGIYGGRFSGAGFKGCCMALIAPDKAEEIEAKVGAEYLKAFPELEGKYSFHLCESADGVEL